MQWTAGTTITLNLWRHAVCRSRAGE